MNNLQNDLFKFSFCRNTIRHTCIGNEKKAGVLFLTRKSACSKIHFIFNSGTATMADKSSNSSSDQRQKDDLKLNAANFEPTSIVTRREHTRNTLFEQFAEDVKSKLTASPPINDEKNLQGFKMVHDATEYEKNRQISPLHREADGSNDFSHWNAYAHPIRRYRRTYEFTKPDSEYFGTAQWR